MMAYNMSFVDNNTNLFNLVSEVNTVGSGILGTMLLIIIFIITFGLLKSYSTKIAILGSSFLSSVVGFLFFFIGLVAWWVVAIMMGLFVAMLLVYAISK